MTSRVGVLALQGDVREHLRALTTAGAEAIRVRTALELADVDALVLPGGESTTIARLLGVFNLLAPLRERLEQGMPTLATCAGMILLSREIEDGRPDQTALGILDITVRRNGFGRQVASFEADVAVEGVAGGGVRGVFIRAPVVVRVGEGAHVVARLDGEPVAVRQGAHLALSFHPELTGDDRIHRLFLEGVAHRPS